MSNRNPANELGPLQTKNKNKIQKYIADIIKHNNDDVTMIDLIGVGTLKKLFDHNICYACMTAYWENKSQYIKNHYCCDIIVSISDLSFPPVQLRSYRVFTIYAKTKDFKNAKLARENHLDNIPIEAFKKVLLFNTKDSLHAFLSHMDLDIEFIELQLTNEVVQIQ